MKQHTPEHTKANLTVFHCQTESTDTNRLREIYNPTVSDKQKCKGMKQLHNILVRDTAKQGSKSRT